MRISVVIPSRNREPNLRQTLTALANQSGLEKNDYEVVVVDDNSSDNTQSLVNEFKDKLNLKYVFSNIPKPHTWNASVIRNLGALVTDPSSTHILFVDSDVALPDHTLKNYLDDILAIPERIIIGPYDFTTQNGDKVKYPNGEEGDIRNVSFREKPIETTHSSISDALACFGGNIVIPKDFFWAVKGFSVDTHIGLEDGDMGLKLWKQGYQFSYDARNRGTHIWHETPVDRFPSDMRNHIDALNMKHFGTKDPDYGIIEASRETYAEWGITGWEPPVEWTKGIIDLNLKINK